MALPVEKVQQGLRVLVLNWEFDLLGSQDGLAEGAAPKEAEFGLGFGLHEGRAFGEAVACLHHVHDGLDDGPRCVESRGGAFLPGQGRSTHCADCLASHGP